MNTDNNLLIVNNKLTKTNEEFAKVNKDLIAVNKELVNVNEQIKQRNIKQKEFISIASHELRTPTQSIFGYTELMLLEPQTKTKYTNLIMRNANRLQKIISDILDVSKIDNNALTLNKEHFKLTEVISCIVHDLRDQLIHNNKSVNIIFDDIDIEKEEEEKDIVIYADKERITRVISNILDNAIRFAKEGIIHINIERNNIINNNKDNIDNNSEEIIIKIIDSAKGLDTQSIPRLFSKFYSTSGTGGTGLGLYICKAIIEAHDGKIWAENNKYGKGATFSFTLPLVHNNIKQSNIKSN